MCAARIILAVSLLVCFMLGVSPVFATPFTETVPNGNGPIPATYPRVGGTMFVLIGANGNIYYQFVNPSTQFQGFQFTGQPAAFRGNPFQLGPAQSLNCGPTACSTYFGGSIVEGYARLTARDGDACPGNFDFNDVFFEVNGFRVGSFSGPEQVERTNRTGTASLGFENCFRNQGSNETSTGWFDLTPVPGLLDNILAQESTTPFVFDDDGSTNRGDNFWFFRDGNDATGTPEVAPGITIEKTSPQTSYSAVNEVIEYDFLVTNIGSVTLTNIVVTDSFITGPVSCDLTTLVSGQSMMCEAEHIVSQQNIDEDITFRNVASVTATPTEGTLGSVSGELIIPGPAANNLMTITKVPSITTGADVGDTITYTYEVQNMGNITLNDVNVTDVHNGVGSLSAITPTDVTLAPGASQQFQATYVVQQGDVDAQTDITNVATTEAVPARGTIVEPTANAAVSVIAENRVLTLDKQTTTTDFTNLGDTISYTYEVTNDGNVSITAPITISDDVIDAAGGNVSCPAIPVGGLLPGNSLTCSANYSVTQPDLNAGSVTNIATASDGVATSNQDSVTVTGTQTPELMIDKRLTAASPTSFDSVGDQLLYEYEVTNTGNITITSDISVSDNRIASVSCPPLTGGILDPGASILCTGTYNVDQDDLDLGNVTNTADATDGTTTSDPDSVVVNATQLPALSLTKTADPIDPVDFRVGAVANYTYVVTNSGNTSIVDPITVTDSRIPSVTCDPLPLVGTPATSRLLPSQSIECQGSYVVDANDVALFEVTNLATATDGNVTSPQVSETIPLGGVPSLMLTKTAAGGSTFANVGDTITYSFEVTNDGTVSFATPITITDNIIPGSPIACYTPTAANPDLTPGESFTCTGTFTYSVDQDDLDAGFVFNEATANTTFMGTTPVVSAPATETVNANTTPSIAISKSALPTAFTSVGETVVYTISVNNDGNQTLTNVMVSDPLIPSLMCTIPTLAVGATDNSCVGNYTVDQDDIDLGRIDNIANASATTPQGTTINGSGNLTINGPTAAPAVEVTKSASPSPFGPENSLINYTFAIRNAGNVRLSNIIVTDPINAGFSCTITTLDPSVTDSTSCSLSYSVQQGDVDIGSITNEATVTATSADPSGQSVDDTDQIITPGPARAPSIEIEKLANISGLSSPAQEDDVISYTFRIENTGNVTLTNVDITDADASVSGAPITLLPSAVDTTSFTATRMLTQDDINDGSFSNQAIVNADTPAGLPPLSEPSDDPSTLTDDDPTVVQLPPAPELSFTKTGVLNAGSNGRSDVGDTIDYTFTVQNTGNVTLSDITISDPIVAVSGGPILELLPTITDSTTFTASYTLTQADINRGEVLNQAIATAQTPDGGSVTEDSDDPTNAAGDNDPTAIPLSREPSIALIKEATLIDGGDGVDENDTIEYTFTVTNTGNVPLTNVNITDPLVTVSGGPITLAPGAIDSTTFTAVHTIQQSEINAGSFTNTATVNGTDPTGTTVSDISDDPAVTTPGNDDPTTVTFPQTPAITVEKVADTSGFSTPPVEGNIITYTFRVENTGNVTLTNVVVTDLDATVSGSAITLLPGAVDTTTFTASYTLEQADINTGSFTNQASVSGNPPTGPPVTNTSDDPADPNSGNDPTVTPIQQVPELTTVKDATIVNFANVGDIVTYEYLVTNTGNTSITSPIRITDNLITNPANITCPALPAGGLLPTAPDNTITCIGTYSVEQADLDRGTVTNLASATDGTTTSPTVSETIPDGAPAALEIVKTTTNPPFTAVGEIITYSYEITNNGGRTLTGTTEVIDDRIPAQINCFTGNLVPISLSGTSQICTATYEITQENLDAGFVTNEAFAQNDNVAAVGTVTSPPDSVTLNAAQNPSITIEKVGDTTGFSTPPQVDDEITYSFTITNTGNVTLTNVIVEDSNATISGSPIATLAPFDLTATVQTNVDTTTYTASRLITQEDIDAGQFTNQATVRATPPSGLEINNTSDDPAVPGANDPTVISIDQTPSIEIEKTAILDDFGDGVVDVDDEILYSFNVINTGNVTLTDITISDPDATISGGPITLAPGINDNTTFTGVHILDQDDINAGTFSNQTTVEATPPGGALPISEPSDDPSTTGVDDDPTTILIPASPSISITKVATIDAGVDGIVNEGDIINYAFRIENTGNVTLTNISVNDDDAAVSGGSLLSLAPDTVDTDTFTAQHVLTQPQIDTGEYTNQATVEATPFGGGLTISEPSDDPFDPTGNDDPTVTVLARSPALTTTKTSGAQSGLAADGTFTQVFSIEVENTGNTTITNPTLVDNLESVFGAGFTPSSAATATSGVTVAPSVSADTGNTGTPPVANATYDGDASSGLLNGSSGSLAPGDIITVTFTALFDSTQLSGTLVNSATASGTPPTGTTLDTTNATNTSDVVAPTDVGGLGLVKTSVIDLTGGNSATVLDAGDTINYTYTVTNTSSTLNALNIVVSEAGGASFTGTNGAPTPASSNNGTTIDATGVTNDLTPNATLTWTASYTLSQEDINAGQVDNSATVAGVDPFGNDLTDISDEASNGSGAGNDDPTVTVLPSSPTMNVEKSLSSVTQVFPFVYDIVYEVNVENTGNVTLTNLQVEDDLSAALSPAIVISTDLAVSGFSGAGGENTAYNGVGVTELLIGDVQLDPTLSGSIIITTRVDFSAGFPSQGNTATATSDMISVPVSSNDPSITPGDPSDVNPTPPPLEDTDNDGSPDNSESSTNDRDGDGIPDAQDYDPTGYFYCQETARILPGGFITVTGPLGTQSGVGTSNNITIVRDGSDGSFQFFVSAPGTYTLNATLPATGIASNDRLPSGTLDATSLLPANPAVLGAGEVGSSGVLSDGGEAANPFYFTFDIAAGDPAIFNNNIPMIFCGAPELTATKTVSGIPTVQPNGNTQFTFQMSAENTGTTQVNDVSLADNLDAVFGAGNFAVVSNTLTSAPTTFAAGSNTGFNGASDTELLETGGTLLVGERVEVELIVEVMAAASGRFTNTVTAGAASPLDGSPITTNDASIDIDVVAPNDVDQLQVEKTAGRSLVRIGEVLPYSITITNPVALPRIGVNIVDFLPAGLIYRPGSGQVDGIAFEPTVSGRRLVFANQDIAANGSVTITFNVGVSAAASAQEFENQAWVEDPATGNRISNIGIATVRREVEHVFDCGEIIGKVFDDKNRNGYQDKGESGLPGVRVATVKGELITTDKHGRYHVPCASIPDANIGSNFILKLDTRTLPTGYRITTENPRVVRLTRGKLTKLNFGASISRVVRIDLNSQAFVSGSIEPSKALSGAFGKLVKKLSSEPSVLKLSYQSNGSDTKLAKKRMRNIAKLIRKRWKRSGGGYDLEIETRVVKK